MNYVKLLSTEQNRTSILERMPDNKITREAVKLRKTRTDYAEN